MSSLLKTPGERGWSLRPGQPRSPLGLALRLPMELSQRRLDRAIGLPGALAWDKGGPAVQLALAQGDRQQ